MKVTYLMIMLQQWQSNHCTFDFLHFLLSNEHEDIDLHSDLCCGTVLILGTLTECVCVLLMVDSKNCLGQYLTPLINTDLFDT